MDKAKKASVVTLVIFFFFCSLVTLTELPMIPTEKRLVFAMGKFLIITSMLLYALLIWQDRWVSTVLKLVGITTISYAVFSQWYRPLYYMAFFQALFINAVIFPVSKSVFRVTASIGAAAFILIFYTRWDQFVEQSKHQVFSDLIFAVLAVTFIAIITNTFFSSERSFHEDALNRFSQIGGHSGRILHDLKGLIAAPKLHVQFLQSRLDHLPVDSELREVLGLIEKDLEGMRQTLIELNMLSIQAPILLEEVAISDCYHIVQKLLSKQLNGIDFQLVGSGSVRANRQSISSLLFNLVLNSAQTLNDRKVLNPKINLLIEPHSISIQDNGGGFVPQVLDSLLQNKFYSTRVEGSGHGLLLAAHTMRTLGGKFMASNLPGGACVELRFRR